VTTPDDDIREDARKRQERRRTRLLASTWGNRVEKCIPDCPWREELLAAAGSEELAFPKTADDGFPLCSLAGAVRGRPCVFERRMFQEAAEGLESVYSPETAALMASVQVQVARAAAVGIDTLNLRLMLLQMATSAEVRLRDILLRHERGSKLLALQEKRLALQNNHKGNRAIVLEAMAKQLEEPDTKADVHNAEPP